MGKATYTVTVTNNSNGVSVDYETETPMTLLVPEVAAEVIKDLVNTVRSYPVRRKTPSFRAGIFGAVFHLTRCLLLFNVLTDGGYWRTSAATGKIARTPQNAFVVIPDCNIWSISSQ